MITLGKGHLDLCPSVVHTQFSKIFSVTACFVSQVSDCCPWATCLGNSKQYIKIERRICYSTADIRGMFINNVDFCCEKVISDYRVTIYT